MRNWQVDILSLNFEISLNVPYSTDYIESSRETKFPSHGHSSRVRELRAVGFALGGLDTDIE